MLCQCVPNFLNSLALLSPLTNTVSDAVLESSLKFRGYAHDYSFFKGRVDKTAASGFQMKEVSGDEGYLGASNMLATLQHDAIPYIPFKTNSVPDSRGSYDPKLELWTKMYHFYALHRAEFLQHYHKRSNVETTFHMIKAKFGPTVAESDANSTGQ